MSYCAEAQLPESEGKIRSWRIEGNENDQAQSVELYRISHNVPV